LPCQPPGGGSHCAVWDPDDRGPAPAAGRAIGGTAEAASIIGGQAPWFVRQKKNSISANGQWCYRLSRVLSANPRRASYLSALRDRLAEVP